MAPKKKALFISQEITPYLKVSALGDLARNFAVKTVEKGYEARMFMPKYGSINERRNQLHEVIRLSGQNISIDDADHPLVLKVATLQQGRIQVYFIDNDDYFVHHAIDDLELATSPAENDERAIFFTRAVMETVKKLRWEPAVIHCLGWLTALAPLYLRLQYADDPTVGRAKIVYTIFNHPFDGTLDPRLQEKLKMDGFKEKDLKALGADPASFQALQRIAIAYADGITVASPDVDAKLLEFAASLGKPVLPFADGADPEKVVEFYDTL